MKARFVRCHRHRPRSWPAPTRFWRSERLRRQSGSAGRPRPRAAGRSSATIRSEPRSFNRLRRARPDDGRDRRCSCRAGWCASTARPSSSSRGWPSGGNRAPTACTHTLHLRPGVTWSDGAPFTSADVLFSLDAVLDPKVEQRARRRAQRRRQADPRRRRPTPQTVVLTYPAPSGPGMRLLDACRSCRSTSSMRRSHAGTLAAAWNSQHAARRARRHGPVRAARIPAGAAAGLRAQPALLAQGAGRRARCRTSIASCSRSCRSRTRSCCACSPARPTCTHGELRPEDYVAGPARAKSRASCALLELGVGHRCGRVLVLPEAGGEAQGPALRVRAEARVPPGDLARRGSRGVRGDGVPRARRSRSGDRSRRATSRGSGRTCRATRTTTRAPASCSRASASRTATATASSKTRPAPRRASR